jgi:hypothetical protein
VVKVVRLTVRLRPLGHHSLQFGHPLDQIGDFQPPQRIVNDGAGRANLIGRPLGREVGPQRLDGLARGPLGLSDGLLDHLSPGRPVGRQESRHRKPALEGCQTNPGRPGRRGVGWLRQQGHDGRLLASGRFSAALAHICSYSLI